MDSGSADFKLYTWPDRDEVLPFPSAWLIDTIGPETPSRPGGFVGDPVHYVLPLAPELVIVGDLFDLSCYRPLGLVWESHDLFCCDDPILTVEGQSLFVPAHKHGEDTGDGETPTPKIVDILTGERTG